MTADSTAASYGLFQVVFANMTYELARALFALRSRRDRHYGWRDVPWKFKQLLRELRRELDKLEGTCTEKDSLAAVRRACHVAERLAPWRDSRTHAIVKQVDSGLALFDWKTGKPLSLTTAECERNMDELVKVICEIPVHMTCLIREFDSSQNMREYFETVLDQEDAS
jgi:hypothetical protein